MLNVKTNNTYNGCNGCLKLCLKIVSFIKRQNYWMSDLTDSRVV